jgi:peroxiredoxin
VRGNPAALVFINSSQGRCAETLDQVIRAATKYRKLRVAAVVIAGERSEAQKLVANHGWKIPVAEDRDGALANLYGVAVCPQIVYLRAGGVVDGVSVGEVSGAELNSRLRALEGSG